MINNIYLRITHRLLTVLLLSIFALAAEAEPQHLTSEQRTDRILIITSYDQIGLESSYSISNNVSSFITKYKELGGKTSIIMESLACQGLSEVREWTKRLKSIFQKYSHEDIRPNIILIIGQEAYATYLNLSKEETLGVPVLCGMVSRNFVEMPDSVTPIDQWFPASHDVSERIESHNIVGGYFYEYNLEKNIELIKELLPGTHNIATLTDNTYGGVTLLSFIRKEMLKFGEMNVISLDGRTMTIYDVIEHLQQVPENTVLLLGTWRVDKTNNFTVRSTISSIHDSNPELPTFTISSLGMGTWTIGGYFPTFPIEGTELAMIAYNYLNKNLDMSDRSRTLRNVKNEYRFDDRVVTFYELDEKKLPKEAIHMHAQPNLWERHHSIVVKIIAAFVILIVIIILMSISTIRMRSLKKRLEIAQEDLEKARLTAEKQSGLKTKFLANMSHEIRAPMNAIVGFSDLLATDDTLSDNDRKMFANIIKQNSNILLSLINDILDMTRIESGNTKYVDEECNMYELCQAAFESVKMVSDKADIEFAFESTVNKENSNIIADSKRIQQVMLNLLTNASKFTDKGSITMKLESNKYDFIVSISDTGIGIPADMHRKVFEPYIKINELALGAGLGLSLCKKIVEHYKGRIWIDPEYTGGSRFIFTIPKTRE
ncbi:MAG: HAMP domain-containing histidine kinase [Bacteroidales bacterium]|nr:HAMP domain-containing histidine kinase [Bacteroidales bacterium]